MTQATARVTLGALVRKLGTRPSAQDRLHVAEKWDRLQARIDRFHRQAMEFWGMTTWDVPIRNPEAAGDRDVAESDTDEEEDENYFELSPLEDDLAPERQPLLLPSNLGMRVCQDQGYLNFLKQEKTLRIGQANDRPFSDLPHCKLGTWRDNTPSPMGQRVPAGDRLATCRPVCIVASSPIGWPVKSTWWRLAPESQCCPVLYGMAGTGKIINKSIVNRLAKWTGKHYFHTIPAGHYPC